MLSGVPSARWAHDERTSAMAEHAPAMRHGGFMQAAELFDHRCYSISASEAAVMDPQQRLVLDHGLTVAHAAGMTKQDLLGSSTGIFVGVWACEYAEVLRDSPAAGVVYAATATTCSVVAGRLSFALGLHGPCVSYDTACSAALVACHSGRQALRHVECAASLAMGVNMIFSPSACASMALAGMT